jgi:mono/diheme cytochrome c family protein
MSLIRFAERTLAGFALAGLAAAPMLGAVGETRYQQRVKFDGGDVFRTYCVVCHGTSAKGDGPLASSMKRPPPDLTQFAKKNEGKFPKDLVGKIIDGREEVKGHGGPNMPVWGDAFSRSLENSDPESVKQKIQALVEYIASVQQK